MAFPGNIQVTGKRLLLAVAALPIFAACGGNCGAHLTVLNASGLAIVTGSIAPGNREPSTLDSLPSPGSREFRFSDLAEGPYSFDIRFADGSIRRDTLGYLTHGMGFRDTLMVHPPGSKEPLSLKQGPGPCRESPRMKTILREFLKKVF